ncbi:signal recognition particle-docking protein FtsY, partial [Filifactor alocis]|uniref:signal recognition particle-docking protein FtsY n=1 Tax=Filifactor alocis TaxID=143361 RepID=UPI003C703609
SEKPEDSIEEQVEEAPVKSEDITEQQAEEISEELHDITEGQVQELSEEHDDIVEEHVEEVPVELVDVTEEEAEEEPEKKGFFARLKEGLSKTTQNITGKIDQMLGNYTKIDEDMLEELEEILITSDVGYETTVEIVDRLRQNLKEKLIDNPAQVKPELKLVIESMLQENQESLRIEESPSILVVVGVNGVGKTTSIGKLAHQMKGQGKSVLLAAADTFRAAAADQLTIWAERAGVDIVKHQEGADPSAVIFDGIHAAKKRNIDVLICDTAGRLHNRKNLMQELGKIFKIVEREYPEANKEVLLVIDATTGQNAMNQAKVFQEVAPLSGIILTKLDGTAKGGVVLAITQELKIPVKFIGVGEQIDDLQMFDASSFAEAMIGE